jgi:hypothetical protein
MAQASFYRGGTLSIEDSVVANNNGRGGIWVASGTGTLIRSTVINNNFCRSTGGVFIEESGTLRVHRSTISNNSSLFRSGGIFNTGKLVVTQSVITNNTGPSSGGIENWGVATLTQSLIANNVANDGNGIPNDGGGISNSGKLTLIDSTVLSNRASSCDEPNCSPPPQGGRGGGIFNAGSAASANLIGSFITSNSADLDGGGVFNEGGTVSQTDTLIINNNPNDCVGC